jgi:hypothetical protein
VLVEEVVELNLQTHLQEMVVLVEVPHIHSQQLDQETLQAHHQVKVIMVVLVLLALHQDMRLVVEGVLVRQVLLALLVVQVVMVQLLQ